MCKIFKRFTCLAIIVLLTSCNSKGADPSSYIELMKNQKLMVFSLDKTIGEVFDVVSKGKVVWKAGPMPANDSEYKYRNIHKTSILVEAFWPINLGILYGNKEVELKFQFAVKKDKSEFELYRTAINGEYENSEETKTTAQSIGVEYLEALKTIAKEKQNNEAINWARLTAPYIDAIKKKHSEIYDDSIENAYNIIASGVRGGKVEWSCQKLDSGKENIQLYVVLAKMPVDEHLWNGWGATANPIIVLGHIAGEDLNKIENNPWKQGDMYAIFRKSELTNLEKIDLSKEKDIKLFKELQDYMFKIYEEKTGKDIKPSQLEIERNEAAPYIESVKKLFSKTYNDTYDNFYAKSTSGNTISEPEWSAYKLESSNPQTDKDLLSIISASEREVFKLFITEMKRYNRSTKICVQYFAGDDWSKATNNKIKNGDIYKIQIDDVGLDMKKPEDAKKWIDIFNGWLSYYWINSNKSMDHPVPLVKSLEEAK